MFTSYTGGNFREVKMVNQGVTKVISIRNAIFVTDVGCKSLVLKDVRHVPDVRLDIISIGKLDDEGYPNHFSARRWKLAKGSQIIAKCQKLNSLYLMQVIVSSGEVNVANKNVFIELWAND